MKTAMKRHCAKTRSGTGCCGLLFTVLTLATAASAAAAGPRLSDTEVLRELASAANAGCPPGFRAFNINNNCPATIYLGEDPATAPGPQSTITCSANNECGPNQFCSGGLCRFIKIAPGETTACKQDIDCPSGQNCNTLIGVTGFCQFKTTTASTFALAAKSQRMVCIPGVVPDSFLGKLPAGSACTTNSDCQSYWCNAGFCSSAVAWGGNLWPRTGCSGSGGNLICETGDCKGKADCDYNSGQPPDALAEFTLQQTPAQDFYDVSQVNGVNVGVKIAPVTGTFQAQPPVFECVPGTKCGTGTCTANGNCPCSTNSDCPYVTQSCPASGPTKGFCTASNQCGFCTSDTSCTDFSMGGGQGYCSCSPKDPCPSPFTCVAGRCSGQPYECGMPGNAGTQSVTLKWPNVATELCRWNAKATCPSELQDLVPLRPSKSCQRDTDCLGVGGICSDNVCQKFVGCYSPNKACGASTPPPGLETLGCNDDAPFLCSTRAQCPVGIDGKETMTCNSGRCECSINSDCPANFQCNNAAHTCEPSSSAPTGWDTWSSLYGCVGTSFYGRSGYTPGLTPGMVCGCPAWSDTSSNGTATCKAHNFNWESARAGNTGPDTGSKYTTQGYAAIFKASCPTAYAYAFDDKTSTYNCAGAPKTPGPSYDITFCPAP